MGSQDNRSPNIVDSHSRVFDKLIQFFIDSLKNGDLKSGDILLSERKLSAHLGVSRGSIREAIRALQVLGILSMGYGKKTYIMSPDPKSLAEVFNLSMSLRPSISKNIVEVRIIIDSEAVGLACQRASHEEIEDIRNSLLKLNNIGDKVNEEQDAAHEAAQTDFNFHKSIIKATHNDFLCFIYDILENLLWQDHLKRWKESILLIPNAFSVVGNAHEEIFNAIRSKNEELAYRYMKSHFQILEDKKR